MHHCHWIEAIAKLGMLIAPRRLYERLLQDYFSSSTLSSSLCNLIGVEGIFDCIYLGLCGYVNKGH